MGRGPGVVTSIMANVLKYNQELVKQLSEVNHTTKTKRAGKKIGVGPAEHKAGNLIDT